MASDSKLPLLIFSALIALIAIPFGINRYQESRRPVLADLRIVTASSADPVFRSGRRRAEPGEDVALAIALRVGRKSELGEWMAPVSELAIDGRIVPFKQTAEWPEDGLMFRVFWFTVESTNLGGALTEDTAAERLRYRTYLAPEMGRGLEADRFPDQHNDDHIGTEGADSGRSGVVRLYARVEVVEREKDIKPLHAMTTMTVDQIFDPSFPTVILSSDFGPSINSAASELFGLPGFEPQAESADGWNLVPLAGLGRSFTDLVNLRVTTSSWTFAAVAAAGSAELEREALTPVGQVTIGNDRILERGRPLNWGKELHAGDLLTDGRRWIVVLSDNGDGLFDAADAVLHCWGRPPERTTLFAALGNETRQLEHLRYASDE